MVHEIDDSLSQPWHLVMIKTALHNYNNIIDLIFIKIVIINLYGMNWTYSFALGRMEIHEFFWIPEILLLDDNSCVTFFCTQKR